MIDEKTPNRQYTLPNPQNAVSEDVYRLIAALQGIDIDVANLLLALADKAASDHTHPLAKINGLVDALAAKQDTSARGAPNGYAGLDANGKLSENQLPAIAISDVFEAASQAAMLALTAENGDSCVRSDLNKSFILKARPASLIANWVELRTPTNAVLSVLGLTGVIIRDDLIVKLGLGSAAFAVVGDFATAVQFSALQLALDDKLPKNGQAADSARLGNETAAQWQAKIDAKAGFATSENAAEVNFPLGSIVVSLGGSNVARRTQANVRLSTSDAHQYRQDGTGALLTGVWVNVGAGHTINGSPAMNMQRIR